MGTGAFLSEPQVDVQFAGTDVPISFVRYYSSKGGRSERLDHNNALGLGWSHTLAERLFAFDAQSVAPTPTSGAGILQYVHRRANGQARVFTCPAPHDPGFAFSCTTNDGSLDELRWTAATPYAWRINTMDGMRTEFGASGLLLRRASLDATPLQYWTVTYDGSSRPIRVDDHLGRYITLAWTSVGTTAISRLVLIKDSAGTTIATYTHDGPGVYLTGVSTAAAEETYTYSSMVLDGATIQLPYLETVTRAGVIVAQMTYDYNAATRNVGQGRVTSVQAVDGKYAFRYANDPRNTCTNTAASTQIIDRSTGGIGGSCTNDAAGDAYCTTQNGSDLAVCDCVGGTGAACTGGTASCRAATCQEFLTVSGGGGLVDFSAAVSTGGNCPCGGAGQSAYSTATATVPRRLVASSDRAGIVTSYAYDALGRLIAQCVNDAGTVDGIGGAQAVVTTTPSSCPVGGRWTRYTYGTVGTDVVHPGQIRFVEERSALVAAGIPKIEYQYSLSTGRTTLIRESGYTRTLADADLWEDRSTTFEYSGPFGMQSAEVGPAGERTERVYWGAGMGNDSYMLRYEHKRVGTASLTTTLSSYTRLGRPQAVTLPSGATMAFAYAFQGMRLTSHSLAGFTTSFTYDAAGRAQQTTEPTGRRIVTTYGAMGRVARKDVFDSSGAGQAERTTYTYDDAGRQTRAQLQRVDSGGVVLSTGGELNATYDQYGNTTTHRRGPQLASTFTYDPGAMGYLDQTLRGDGNLEEYAQDAFGRETFVRKTFAVGSTGQRDFSYAQPSGTETGAAQPTQITEPGGRTRAYRYNDFGELVRSDSSEWGIVRWSWTQGRMLQTKWSDGRRTDFAYDQLDRVTLIDNDAANPSLLGQDFRFYYDNDGTITCQPSAYGCNYRRGHLARVEIEYAPGAFWSMYYDYTALGQVGFERWPDTRESRYAYDSVGRLTSMRFPGSSQDYLRLAYDAVNGNGLDQEEVVQVLSDRTTLGSTYVTWARSIQRDTAGRLTSLLTHDAAATPSTVRYRTDGRIDWIAARRRNGVGTIGMLDRIYTYSADGSAKGHDSVVSGDAGRTFIYDGANRLTCTGTPQGLVTCPAPGASLIESYSYAGADERLTRVSPAGATTYAYLSGGAALYDELPPARTIWYGSANADVGGNRTYDQEVTGGSPLNQRGYTYDAQGRLRTVTLPRPTATASTTRQNHILNVLYDHRSRPIWVSDLNTSTSVDAWTSYYYDLEDRLVNRIVTPNVAAPSTYTVDSYIPIEPLLIGNIHTDYPAGTETLLYHVVSPEGVPQTGWSFNRTTFVTAEAWRAQYAPFGARISPVPTSPAAPAFRPPQRFQGQLELAGSDASWWNGSAFFVSRDELVLNRWRVYDPRLGLYLQTDPYAIEGRTELEGAYAYSFSDPLDFVDPEGRQSPLGGVAVGAGAAGGAATGAGGTAAGGVVACGPACWTALGATAAIALGLGVIVLVVYECGVIVEYLWEMTARCVRQQLKCVRKCNPSLVSGGEWPFRRCINECMQAAGCPSVLGL